MDDDDVVVLHDGADGLGMRTEVLHQRGAGGERGAKREGPARGHGADDGRQHALAVEHDGPAADVVLRDDRAVLIFDDDGGQIGLAVGVEVGQDGLAEGVPADLDGGEGSDLFADRFL